MENVLAEIILLLVFILIFLFGFFLIYKQVALVKKGEFNLKDRLQCIIYGAIFSIAVMIVISMAVIFTIQTIDPWFLLIPFFICLLYVSFYPLIDFLFIALSKETDEGLTPFHKFIGKNFINISKKKIVSFLMALGLYSLFILPPIILAALGVPFLLIWIFWMLIYPLLILVLYGTKGYIAGISNEYYHIPEIKRYLFLNFENSERGMKQFISFPRPYIVLGFMIFVFIWAWISLFQTISFFFTGKLAISTMSSYFVYITLFFGIVGYFTRFWGRKIKYRGIDIYFAAYLMAAIGLNVFVNFILVNINTLATTLNSWSLTQEIVPTYLLYAWPSIIEEIALITFTSYYLLSKINEFKFNIRFSKITECGQNFDPIPLFNLIKNPNHELQTHAENTLILMFERIPLKYEISPNEWKFKDLLIDGLCDPNINSRKVCYKILKQLQKDIPEKVIPWVIEGLKSPNYDKKIPLAQSLLDLNEEFLDKIPLYLIFRLVNDSEWRIRLIGVKLISRLTKQDNKLISELNISELLDDPNSKIQIETFKLLENSKYSIPIGTIRNKFNHPNKHVRAAAIKNLKHLPIEEVNSELLNQIIPHMIDPTAIVRSSTFEFFAKIGNFKKYSIPVEPIFQSLLDPDEMVRKTAIIALKKYFDENPRAIDIDMIINKIDPNNTEVLKSVLYLLSDLWEKDPEKILTILLIFIKFKDNELKNQISNILTKKYSKSPNLIFENLLKIKDESKFISKGIIARTIIKIGKENPEKIIPKLMKSINIENDLDTNLNSIISLEGLIEEHIDKFNPELIIPIFQKSFDIEIQKEASNLIAKIAKVKPGILKSIINDLLELQNHLELSVRILLIKSILEIAKQEPNLIQLSNIINLISDKDSFIREAGVKILGYIGYKVPRESVNILLNKALIDEEWIVRDAAVVSLGNILKKVDNKQEIIEKLVLLMDDANNWVRKSSMNLIASIEDIEFSLVPFEKVLNNLNSEDDKIRQGAANLLRIYPFKRIKDNFEKIILILGDESEEVRRIIINTIVEFIQNHGLSKILSNLLKNLSDSGSLITQQSIALILGRTAKYEDEKIKKRVIALLKVRCEMSQDPIICEMLAKLKEQ